MRENEIESGIQIEGSFLKEYNRHESHVSYDSSSHNIYYPNFSSGPLPEEPALSKNKNFFELDEFFLPELKEYSIANNLKTFTNPSSKSFAVS